MQWVLYTPKLYGGLACFKHYFFRLWVSVFSVLPQLIWDLWVENYLFVKKKKSQNEQVAVSGIAWCFDTNAYDTNISLWLCSYGREHILRGQGILCACFPQDYLWNCEHQKHNGRHMGALTNVSMLHSTFEEEDGQSVGLSSWLLPSHPADTPTQVIGR